MELDCICSKSLIKTQSMKLPRIILIINCSDPSGQAAWVRLAIIALLPPLSDCPHCRLYCPQLRFAQFLQRLRAVCGIVGRAERTECWGPGTLSSDPAIVRGGGHGHGLSLVISPCSGFWLAGSSSSVSPERQARLVPPYLHSRRLRLNLQRGVWQGRLFNFVTVRTNFRFWGSIVYRWLAKLLKSNEGILSN